MPRKILKINFCLGAFHDYLFLCLHFWTFIPDFSNLAWSPETFKAFQRTESFSETENGSCQSVSLRVKFRNAHLLVLLWTVIQTLTFQSSLFHLVVIFRLNIV